MDKMESSLLLCLLFTGFWIVSVCDIFESPPRNVEAKAETSTSVTVSWDEPEIPNDVIIQGYIVFYTPKSKAGMHFFFRDQEQVDANTRLKTLRQLRPDTTYIINVLAYSMDGQGPPSDPISVHTKHTIHRGDPRLLLANRLDIRFVDFGSDGANDTLVLAHLKSATAIDFLYVDDVIFWADLELAAIQRYRLDATGPPETVASSGLVSPDWVAVDWLGRKLYWTDSETDRIEVSNLDGGFRKVLYWQGLDQPRAVALDPGNGYMYWTDWGDWPKIEKAGMDGRAETRSILIDEEIGWPNGLTLDYDTSRIYWADAKFNQIHSCDFDGTNRLAIVEEDPQHPFGLTLYEDTLYWTDWSTDSIHGCHKLTGADAFVARDKIDSPMDVRAFMPSRQPKGRNMCGENNGGCSHLCLLSPTPPYFTCACPTGVRLLEDESTCAAGAEKSLFLARRRDICQISLDTPDHTALTLPLRRLQHATSVDYDGFNGFLYWTDTETQTIQRARLDGTDQEVIVEGEVDKPDGLAVDWIAGNLYWTDTGTDRIEVARVDGGARKALIWDGLDEPRAICLDPAAGYMYWADWGKKPAISRAYLDGSRRHVVIDTGLRWPNGLAIDIAEQRLYWGDASTDRMEVADMDGTNRKVLVSENLPHIFGFTLLGDYIYWTDWQTRSIERVNKNTGLNRTSIMVQIPDMMGLKAVDVNKIEGTNACAKNNGNCSHLCLFRPPPNKQICACPIDLVLGEDETTCMEPGALVIFTSSSGIGHMVFGSDQTNQPVPVRGVEKARAIDFDIQDNRIYWTDVRLKCISRAFVNGSSLEHIVKTGIFAPKGMAVDWVAHNIYWADTRKNYIEVARLNGSSRRVLVWENLKKPRALAVDPSNGYMYWTVWGDEPVLERAHLDGTHRKVLVKGIGHVHDMTIDYQDHRLYWADATDRSIKSSDMNGEDLRVVVQSKIKQPMGLTQYQDFIYWTDAKRKTIERANKTNGANRTLVLDNVDSIMDIAVFHLSLQRGDNTCGQNNGGCSHLCMAHPATMNSTHHCACPTHYTLNDDQRLCLHGDISNSTTIPPSTTRAITVPTINTTTITATTTTTTTTTTTAVAGKSCISKYDCIEEAYGGRCLDNRCTCSDDAVIQGQTCQLRPSRPELKTVPSFQEFCYGETFYLVCTAGEPIPSSVTFTFLRGNEPLDLKPNSNVRWSHHTLQVTNASSEDSSTYSCRVNHRGVSSFESNALSVEVKEFVDLNCDFLIGLCDWTKVYGSEISNPSLKSTISSEPYLELHHHDLEKNPRILLRSPVIPRTASESCFSFRYRMSGPTVNSLTVLKYTFSKKWNEDQSFIQWRTVGDQGDEWKLQNITISPDVQFYIAFESIGNVGIEDVVLMYRKSCQ